MSRVSPAEVKEIVKTSLTDPVIQIWIDGANLIVNANAECIAGDEVLLTQVELMLSAHFVAMLNPATRGYIVKDKLDVFDTTYSSPIGLKNSLDNTTYGTMANSLSNGCLASANEVKASVSFY